MPESFKKLIVWPRANCPRPLPQARFLAVPPLLFFVSAVLGGLLGPDVLAGSSPGGAFGEAPQESRTQQKPTDPQDFPGESTEDAKARMQYEPSLKPERISIVPPEGSIPMGNPVRLVLKLAPGKVNTIIYMQSSLDHEMGRAVEIGGGVAKIVEEDGNSKTFEFVPRELGHLELLVQVVYSDNAFAQQTVKLNVTPSTVGLKKFALDLGGDLLKLKLDGVEGLKQHWLRPRVTYESQKLPFDLYDSKYIKLTIEQDEENPAIRVDEGGTIYALRVGNAVVIGDYAGVKDRINVIVEEE